MAINVRVSRAVVLGAAACLLMFAITQSASAQKATGASGAPPAKVASGATPALNPPEVSRAGLESSAAPDVVPTNFRYQLQVDNNLSLRASRLDPKGVNLPARAKVVIARDGQIFASVRTDEWGAAQVVGLKPAVYSVLSAGVDGFAAITVRVHPFGAPGDNRKAPDDNGKPGSTPKLRAASLSPPQAPEENGAVQVHLAPNSEYAFLKTLMQHKGDFVLLVVREGDVVTSIRPRDDGTYSLADIAAGRYSVLGGGLSHRARTFYASGIYHAAAKPTAAPPRAGAQLLPGPGDLRARVRRAQLCGFHADAGDPDLTVSEVPVADFAILDQIVQEVIGQVAAAPAAAAGAAPAAGAAGGGGAGLGGLMGIAGVGLGAAGLGGGGGGAGAGGAASLFVPSTTGTPAP